MAKYKVVRPIERNQRLYCPAASHAPSQVKSCAHGNDIPTDFSGVIDLSPEEATLFSLGQIELLPAPAPVSSRKEKKE